MWLEFLYRLDVFAILYLLGTALGLWRWRSLNAGDKLIWAIVFLSLLEEFVLVIFTKKGQYNLFIHNIADIIKFTLFFLYFKVKSPQKWIRIACLFLIPGFIIWGLVNYFTIQGINTFNTLTYIPEAFIVGLFSYLNLRRLIIADSISKHNMQLWILIANCLYFFVTLPLQTLEPLITQVSLNVATILYDITVIFQYIWIILISLGFIWKKRSHI